MLGIFIDRAVGVEIQRVVVPVRFQIDRRLDRDDVIGQRMRRLTEDVTVETPGDIEVGVQDEAAEPQAGRIVIGTGAVGDRLAARNFLVWKYWWGRHRDAQTRLRVGVVHRLLGGRGL